jgi:hypothetical protein
MSGTERPDRIQRLQCKLVTINESEGKVELSREGTTQVMTFAEARLYVRAELVISREEVESGVFTFIRRESRWLIHHSADRACTINNGVLIVAGEFVTVQTNETEQVLQVESITAEGVIGRRHSIHG